MENLNNNGYIHNSGFKEDETMACEACSAPGLVVGHKDYSVDADGTVTETLVWQCADPSKLHRWETVNTTHVDKGAVPIPAYMVDPHLHQDKNFAFIDGPHNHEVPESSNGLLPGAPGNVTDGRGADGLTIHDGTEDARDEETSYHADGSQFKEDESAFSDQRPNAGNFDANGTLVEEGTDQTADSARTTSTRKRGKNEAVKYGDARPSTDEVQNPALPADSTEQENDEAKPNAF